MADQYVSTTFAENIKGRYLPPWVHGGTFAKNSEGRNLPPWLHRGKYVRIKTVFELQIYFRIGVTLFPYTPTTIPVDGADQFHYNDLSTTSSSCGTE